MNATNLRVRAETDDDARRVRAVITAAFGDEATDVAALWEDVRRGDLWHAGFVAVEDDPETEPEGDLEPDRVVGHVGLSHAWLDARARLVDVAVLSPLSVAPERQRSGIGTRLLDAAVRAALQRVPAVVLEGDPGYYGARGFVPAGTYGILPPSDRVPAAACQVVVGDGFDDEMAGRIVYPEVWWRHDAVGLRDPLLAEVERRLR